MRPLSRRRFVALCLITPLAACGGDRNSVPPPQPQPFVAQAEPPLYPNETPELRVQINAWADHYDLPRPLVHKLAIRESNHRPWVKAGPYYGLLQILPSTARTMGFRGKPNDLFDADTNLKFGLKYLRGAWILSDGDYDAAIGWYSKGYYYEAKRRGLLRETGQG